MFEASMEYNFTTGSRDRFLEDWNREIFLKAKNREGLRSMRLYMEDTKALALGVWECQDQAQRFMQTGIFKAFLEVAKDYLIQDPVPRGLTLALEIQHISQ